METNQYFESIDFNYLKTYSFNRGQKLDLFIQDKKQEIERVEKEMPTARFMQLPALSKRLDVLKRQINLKNIGLMDNQQRIHITAIEKVTLKKSDERTERLKEIFNIPVKEVLASGCVPLYRDAIVFYDKEDNIVSVLNICFECWFLRTSEDDLLGYDISFWG